jgi:hypothetical protein
MIDPPEGVRDMLARRGLAEIPRILSLQDRTPVSPTYGCFDRDYWHTRVMDFPSGMYQKLVFPLALAWSLDIPGNPYRGQEAIRSAIEAGIRYAARSAHKDGSCDDYFPFERAAGAAAFSLLACLEAAEIIGLAGDAEVDAFLKLRGKWLAYHQESGRLSNHEALIASCLARLADRFGEEWEEPMRRRLDRLLSWQSDEGWFDEYGGADPGYLTLTIAQLADLDRRRPQLDLRKPCAAAVRFLATMVHPDGSLGGEYTSRSTYNFFPYGLEIAGAWMPEALAINDLALRPLMRGRDPAYPERFEGHFVTSWLLAWREWQAARPAEPHRLFSGRIAYPGARLLLDERHGTRLYIATSRGGALRLFDGDRLLLADTGISLSTRKGQVAVCHLEGRNEVEIEADRIRIGGAMAFAKSARLTPFKSMVLRGLMITLGRFFPDTIRKILQRLLVTGRDEAPFRFRRELRWGAGGWVIRDEVTPAGSWSNVTAIGIGGFQSSAATVTARVWQPAELQPWLDLSSRLEELGPADPLIVEREVGAGSGGGGKQA